MLGTGLDTLLDTAGADSRRLRHALMLVCDGQWWTRADLVRRSATSRRSIEALLGALELEHDGERFRVPLEKAGEHQALFAMAPPPADPVEHLLPHYRDVLERLERLIAAAPGARAELDHVSATPETVMRRALLLGARFWLHGAKVLCVGDHDLTSLAIKLVHPEAEVTVVDVDDRILAYIDAQGLGVRTRWADLRLGLPASVQEHDLAITDPPYTPEGIGLFVARAVEGLKDDGRVLLAYGASERTPMLALKVQNSLSELNLAYEAMYPDFNRYFGAEAIGSAADLYILRPTSKTRPAVAARVDRYATAIYTHGPQSIEAATPFVRTPGHDFGDFDWNLLVGEWSKDVDLPRAQLATWLAKPFAGPQANVAVSLPSGMEAALVRVLLAGHPGRIRVWMKALPGDLDRIERVLAPLYMISTRGPVVQGIRLDWPFDPPQDPVAELTQRLLGKGHGKLGNTWREPLIWHAKQRKVRLTKNEARAIIAEAAPWADGLAPVEAPMHLLEALPAAIEATLRRVGAVT
ncbi:bis-aminopropyl spermidine synthase family protein [Nonomuraea soli]|uniref:N(4)-bis(aminopropyl)spermidine synthase C-terminal domain-containing protein n=1 Tax=Nonomuraea soli TaxID=1032476 RepID=A0A7W0CEN7_9ACTN|nr:bis-aminopropyl spermidine synthase family protein [Nonomuraea soli]MBA2889783.1 hypothetical protein [Nonomuraea soli]